MSNHNSAWCDVANESDFYSCSWEASFSHSHCSCKALTGSDSESDLQAYIDTKGQCRSLAEERERNKRTDDLTEILASENNQTSRKSNSRDCLLLRGNRSQHSRGSQREKVPESTPPSSFNRNQIIDPPSAYCSARVQQSRSALSSQKDSLSKSAHPRLLHTQQPTEEPVFFTIKKAYIVNKLHRKHRSADSPATSKCNKAVQTSFACRGEDLGERIVCECLNQSSLKEERNKTRYKKKVAAFHNFESSANQDLSSGKLVSGYLHCPLEAVTDIPVKPHPSKHWCLPISSSTLVISLALEADYSVPSVPLAGAEAKYISSSRVRKVRGDAGGPALAFKFKEPELNQYFNRLCISIVPKPAHLDTDTQNQALMFTGHIGHQQVPGPEANQPLETQTDSSDSDIPGVQIQQASSVFKPPSAKQFFVSSEDTQDTVCPSTSYSVQKIPHREGISIKEPSEEQKHQLKACRAIRHPIVSTKPREAERDLRFINKPRISSNLDNTKALDIKPFKQRPGHYKTVKETDTLNKVPLSEAVKCHCSPLSNLSVNLYPKRRYPGSEKSLRISRKPSKRGGVTHRFSAQSLLSDRDSTEETQYVSPAKRKKDLKMQSILNFCFGWPGAQKKPEWPVSEGEIPSMADDLLTKEECLLSPPLPPERRSLPAPFLQGERESQSTVDRTLHPEDNVGTLNDPYPGNVSNLVLPPECRSMFKTDDNIPLEKLDSESAPAPSGDSILKKLMFCKCGQMPQRGLFPNGDIFQSVTEETRSRPATGMGSCKPEPAKDCCHRDLNEPYWYNNRAVFPTHLSLENIRQQEATRGQFKNAQSYFETSAPAKTVTDGLLKEGKGIDVVEFGAPGMYSATPSVVGGREKTQPESSIYHPNCFSPCQPKTTPKRGIAGDYYNCFKSKQEEPENDLHIERECTADPCLGNRSQCRCSQEIPFPYLEQSTVHGESRGTLPKRNDRDLIQDSSPSQGAWKRAEEPAGWLGQQSSVQPAGGSVAE